MATHNGSSQHSDTINTEFDAEDMLFAAFNDAIDNAGGPFTDEEIDDTEMTIRVSVEMEMGDA